MTNSIIAYIIVLLFYGSATGLQIFLSKQQNKFLGLILPICCFMISIASTGAFLSFSSLSENQIMSVDNVASPEDDIIGYVGEAGEEVEGAEGEEIVEPTPLPSQEPIVTPFDDSIETPIEKIVSTSNLVLQAIPIFLYSNIPTLLLIIIYYVFRKKINKEAMLEKMNIQDLE